MEHEVMVEIDAPAEKVWSVLADVESWSAWTESMTRLERLDDGPLAVGSKVRVKQPRLATAVWEVTALEPGKSFSWTSRTPGVTTVADHDVDAVDPATSRVILRVRQTGALAGLVGFFFGRTGKRYMEMEADGLKAQAELRPIE